MSFKFGIINTVDYSKGLAKVYFEDIDLLSHWLPVLSQGTDKDKVYFPFEDGTQVACAMDENFEYGAILGAVYSKEDTTPEGAGKGKFIKEFEDGTVFSYNKTTHIYSIKMGSTEFVINKTGGFKLKKGSEELKALMSDIMTEMMGITVTTSPAGGTSSPPVTAASTMPMLVARIEAFFGA